MADALLDRRLALDKLLRAIVKERCGSENVYYQPKNGLAMNYPCICYERSKIRNVAADDNVYLQRFFYTLTVIDPKPDSPMVLAASRLPRCGHDRHFISDGLHHDAFTIYY